MLDKRRKCIKLLSKVPVQCIADETYVTDSLPIDDSNILRAS